MVLKRNNQGCPTGQEELFKLRPNTWDFFPKDMKSTRTPQIQISTDADHSGM